MKKIKTTIIFLIALTSIFFISTSSVPNVLGADLDYHDVIIEFKSGNTSIAPSLSLIIGSITDPDNGGNNITSPPEHNYIILKDSVEISSGIMTASGNVWSSDVDLSGFEDGLYIVAFNFTTVSGVKRGYVEMTDQSFTLAHVLLIDYTALFDIDDDGFTISFEKLKSSNTNGKDVNELSVTSATYHVGKNGREVFSGNLNYNSGKYDTDVSMSWKFSGEFYVWVEFTYDGVDYSTYVIDDPIITHIVIRSAPMETSILVVAIIIGTVIAVLALIIIRSKRGSGRIENRKVAKETGPIEVIDLKKKNVQKLDTKKITKKKQKGKTQVNKDLIFSVPQWEEEDLVGDSESYEAVNDETTSLHEELSYSMHCPECDSWFEIEKFVEIDCPKCDASLSLAMYCRSEDKWFDVPKPGDYDCPTCSKKLVLSK